MTIRSPGWSPKQLLSGIGVRDHLRGRQACPEFDSFHQGLGQICPGGAIFVPFPPKTGTNLRHPRPSQMLNDSLVLVFRRQSRSTGHRCEGPPIYSMPTDIYIYESRCLKF